MKYILLFLVGTVVTVSGCAMFTAWKSIPPPGGCDQCHTLPISANWQAMYEPAKVSDERGRLSFQTPEYNQQNLGGQKSPLDTKKVEEKACFDCHSDPTKSHKDFRGRYHH